MTENKCEEPQDDSAQQGVELVTKDNFAATDCEVPIANSNKVDCKSLGSIYQSAANEEKEAGNEVAVRVFRLLALVCTIHFKPYDTAEPYGPMGVFGTERTLIPSDLKGDQSTVFAEIVPDIRNPGLRARLADIAWINDRKLAASARQAIKAYCEAVQLVLDGKAELFPEERRASSKRGCNMLRRACQIASSIGWKEPEKSGLKSLIKAVTSDAFNSKDNRGFLNAGELCLDYRIEDPVILAENAAAMAASESKDPHGSQDLWRLAARGYQYAEKGQDSNRCLVNAAECYVTMASAAGFKGMVAASWLMDAIKELRRIPNTKERRQELEAKLQSAQAGIPDEMGTISTELDLTDWVDHARESVAGLTLAEALIRFVNLEKSPEIAKLHDDVQKQVEENPLQSMVPTSIHDDEGKVVAESPGLAGGEESDDIAIRHLILRNEGFRRQTAVSGLIEPARRLISSEHPIDQRCLHPIAVMSPFIPAGRMDNFALGFSRFFNGDHISALHILVPQLEHSLRHVLKQAGVDPSGIQSDMTQESRTLSKMLEKDRESLEKIFGPNIVFEIENLFDLKGGPAIRHHLAHGLISGAACYEPDSIYACWFIFRLCCLPLLPHWQQVIDSLNEL